MYMAYKKKTAQSSKKTTSGKNTAAKKTTGKQKTVDQKKTSARQSEQALLKIKQEEHHKRQVWGVILFAVGLLVLALIFIPGQNLWNGVHKILFGLFGIGVFVLPVLLIYIAIQATVNENMGKIRHKFWQSFGFVCLLCGMIQVVFIGKFSTDGFWNSIKLLYTEGVKLKSGGAVSSILGLPLVAACGRVGASIIILLFLFAFTLLITGTNLIEAFHAMTRPVKKIEEEYVRIREEKEEHQRFDIDVDLGPDPEEVMPQHPVSSPKSTAQPAVEETTPKSSAMEAFLQTVRRYKGQKDEETPVPAAPVAETPAEPEVPSIPEDTEPNAPSCAEPSVVEAPAKEEEKSSQEEGTFVSEQATAETDEKEVLSQLDYVYPPVSLLRAPANQKNRDFSEESKNNAELLVNTLKSFGVQTRVVAISHGPTVTRYELQPSAGVKISKITGLADDIALNLAAAGVRIEAPIPNKAAVGIEVPNKATEIVTLREIVDSATFRTAKSKLTVALGKDISGAEMICDISKMPHILIAGSTGSGKSVCINSIIMSVLYKASPSEVKLLMIDPKIVELGAYNGIPHLLVPVVTDPKKAAGALGWAVTEMLKRYKVFADHGVRDLTGYNALAAEKEDLNPMPQIMIIIDELADLMMAAPNEVEDSICRLAQMARAAGMHLAIATQRPSVDVITGLIKANIPSRIAFAVSSQVDSRTILDQGGAEKLLGKGDMLFYPVGMPKPTRLQGCFLTDKERDDVIDFVKNSGVSEYDDSVMDEIEKQAVKEKETKERDSGGFDEEDALFSQAVEAVIEAGQASTSYLQRRLKVGYARAARLIDDMESKGIVGPFEGSKPRQVLMTRNQWLEMTLNQAPQETEE